ncbi:hypothetical protein PHMEG_00035388 [Phytophthora megakarya]|uniref:Uncharacterized protein n=1 Tax=Phytophthora megakarya TaxID=4795 RepID=A0A225UNV1_9STRA|nr:hypothetical protein PHMEG_00035388 [Phytophthora megakarya]
MDGYDWVKLRREVYEIRENTSIYCVDRAEQAPLREEIDGVEGNTEQQLRARVKEKIAHDSTIPPLDFVNIQAQDFVTWLVTLKRRDCGLLSYSALNTHTAELFNLYRDFEFTMTTTQESELTNQFKGLKTSWLKTWETVLVTSRQANTH